MAKVEMKEGESEAGGKGVEYLKKASKGELDGLRFGILPNRNKFERAAFTFPPHPAY
jgi:hypothetical protein